MPALVSAVIPTYNRADLICRAVDSVLQQSYADVEAVVVDDGSKDATEEVVAARYGADPRVRYLRVPNGGVSRARNIGIAQSRGDYVAFLDSDDYWLPWKIELQVKCLARVPEAGMIWTNMTAVAEDGSVVKPAYLRQMYTAYQRLSREGVSLFGLPIRITAAELSIAAFSRDIDLFCGDIFSQMILGNLVHTSATLLRRERLEKVVGFREDLRITGEDYDFHLRTCREGPVAFVDVESIGYTIGRSDQLTSPHLSAQIAENALRTLHSALADNSRQIRLPQGAVSRMLSDTHGWAASALIEEGRHRDAWIHAWKSWLARPLQTSAYSTGLRALLPPRGLQAMRRIYRGIKSTVRG
jgi:glycosyltransferase involved in cell wall biosynthesis